MTHGDAALTVALALAVGVLVQALARLSRVPAIILLLGVGVALGPDGLHWINPSALGESLITLVDFAIAVILFEGALNLEISRIRREEQIIRRLVTVGALVTLVGGTLAATLWFGWSWNVAILFGSLVVVTGPTVVGPLVRNLRLRPHVQTVLEAEGVLIDPIGALLAVLVLQFTLAADMSGAANELRNLVLRLLLGGAVGIGGGAVMALLLRRPAVVHGLENVITLSIVILLFQACESVLTQSGLLAVTIAGMVVGASETPGDQNLREFKDQLALLLIGGIFILLAADVRVREVFALGWPGVGVLATLILVIRPLAVWVSGLGTETGGAERLFVSAIAPRGIVAAAIASLTAQALDQQGIPGGSELRALVFLVIAGTVMAAGVLAWPLSTLLGLRLASRSRIAILGAQGLGLALAGALRDRGETVIVIDSDPRRLRDAEALGFPVVFGDALQERTMRRLQVELVGTVVGLTFNDNLNSQFVRFARSAFGVKHGFVSVDTLVGAKHPPEHVKRHGAAILFEGAHDQERWDVRWRQREVETEEFEFATPEVEPAQGAETKPAENGGGEELRPVIERHELYVLLVVQRAKRVRPYGMDFTPKAGDRAWVAIHAPMHERAIAHLASLGWRRVQVPESEAVLEA